MQDRLKIIENALNWQQEGEQEGKIRRVVVEVDNYRSDKKTFTVWCSQVKGSFNYGEFVQDGRVINLEPGIQKERLKKLAELKKELEGEQ